MRKMQFVTGLVAAAGMAAVLGAAQAAPGTSTVSPFAGHYDGVDPAGAGWWYDITISRSGAVSSSYSYAGTVGFFKQKHKAKAAGAPHYKSSGSMSGTITADGFLSVSGSTYFRLGDYPATTRQFSATTTMTILPSGDLLGTQTNGDPIQWRKK